MARSKLFAAMTPARVGRASANSTSNSKSGRRKRRKRRTTS